MTTTHGSERRRPTAIDGRAPSHGRGAMRLLITPGAVRLGDGAGGHAVLLVRLGRPDGSLESLSRGTSLYGAGEVAAGAIRDREPDAVWITDRSYLRRHWAPWTLRTVESRLAAAAEGADAALVAWTGNGREATTNADGS